MRSEIDLPPHGTPPAFETRLPCRFCGSPTLREVLAHYGARCLECYEAYVREPQPAPRVGDKTIGPRAWASALKARDEAGERLTPSQREMYRDALRLDPKEAP